MIGRRVIDCHPPKSMAVVEKILEDFKSGARDQADFGLICIVLIKSLYSLLCDEG